MTPRSYQMVGFGKQKEGFYLEKPAKYQELLMQLSKLFQTTNTWCCVGTWTFLKDNSFQCFRWSQHNWHLAVIKHFKPLWVKTLVAVQFFTSNNKPWSDILFKNQIINLRSKVKSPPFSPCLWTFCQKNNNKKPHIKVQRDYRLSIWKRSVGQKTIR